MPKYLKFLYEYHRDTGHYEVDWVDRLLWKIFFILVGILVLV